MPSVENIGEFNRDKEFDDWWHSQEIAIPFLSGIKMPISVIDLPENEFESGNFPSEVGMTRTSDEECLTRKQGRL